MRVEHSIWRLRFDAGMTDDHQRRQRPADARAVVWAGLVNGQLVAVGAGATGFGGV
ncbi:MAG: hypothetical protein U0031_19750 [Thermomicrobiales bacterium]